MAPIAPLITAVIAHPFIAAAAATTVVAGTKAMTQKPPAMPSITPITPPAAPKAPEVPTPVVPSLLTTPSTTAADNELATQTQELKDAETAKLAKKKRSTILTSPRGVLESAKIGYKTLLGE